MEKDFIITISRTYGSGGKHLGKLLAAELDVPFYDRELLELASHTEDYTDDEELSYIVDKDGVRPNMELFQKQSQAIIEAADKGSCVIVGRCADFVLRERERVLNVFVTASPRARLRRIMRLYSMNPPEAKEAIRCKDKTRGTYYEFHTGRRWQDAGNFHLCLNSGAVGFDACRDTVRRYLKGLLDEEKSGI